MEAIANGITRISEEENTIREVNGIADGKTFAAVLLQMAMP